MKFGKMEHPCDEPPLSGVARGALLVIAGEFVTKIVVSVS